VCFPKESTSVGAHGTPILILANNRRGPRSEAAPLSEKGERNECDGVPLGFVDGNETRGHEENVE
jgi:hypothetical protein